MLCSEDGKPIAVKAIEFDAAVEPDQIRAIIRYHPALDQADDPAFTWGPIAMLRGTPDHLVGDPDRPLGGEFREFEPMMIDQQCSDDPSVPFTELITAMKVGPEGGWVTSIDIDYTHGGSDYTLRTEWQYVACGNETERTGLCDP